MLGAIVGDIVGSFYEFAHWKKRDFQPLFHPKADFTDDTVCTVAVAVAQALLENRDPAACLREWCRRYPGRGYGGRFRRWIADDRMRAYGSYGNGAAMRVSPAGFLARALDEALAMARRVMEVTHDHPEGLKGAAATTHAIFLARQGANANDIRAAITATYGYDLSRTVAEIRADYGFRKSCQETVPEAIICALEAETFEDAIRDAVSLGGDADTLGAIAGGIAEARFGIPGTIGQQVWRKVPEAIGALVMHAYTERRSCSEPLPSQMHP